MIEYIVAIFAIWAILLYIVKKKGKKYGLEIAGPLLMWKTEKGKKFIDRIAKRNVWQWYGNAAIVISIIAMILTTALIIWNLSISFRIPPQAAPSPRLILGIPGINPIIPIGYGVIALAVAIIVHEFSHGILARYGRVKVKSLGLLFLIVPVGAFVEPDEDELKRVSRVKRSRVFAAGPASNIILALICLMLLAFIFSPLITPKVDGAIVGYDAYGIDRWSVIANVEGMEVKSVQDFVNFINSTEAGKFYNITLWKDNSLIDKKILNGIYVLDVVKDSPAEEKIRKGDIIYEINGKAVKSSKDFLKIMNETVAGQEITISYYRNTSFYNASVILADRYDFTGTDKGKGFLGIEAAGLQDILLDTQYFQKLYNPFKGNFLGYLALPFRGLSSMPADLQHIYAPSPTFWMMYSLIYWIFWLNFAVGTFNALPSLPLDGGYIFRDGISYIISKFGVKKREKMEKISSYITNAVSVAIFLCIFSIILVPRLRLLISF
ncbi:MAG: site-2 protease family protein [Thermoplasmata archaeon]|nr:site-2 protease family protein [Thermoplasmata archaeon]